MTEKMGQHLSPRRCHRTIGILEERFQAEDVDIIRERVDRIDEVLPRIEVGRIVTDRLQFLPVHLQKFLYIVFPLEHPAVQLDEQKEWDKESASHKDGRCQMMIKIDEARDGEDEEHEAQSAHTIYSLRGDGQLVCRLRLFRTVTGDNIRNSTHRFVL